MNTRQLGVEITNGPCPKCGASDADLCGEMEETTYPAGLEIVRLRTLLGAIER